MGKKTLLKKIKNPLTKLGIIILFFGYFCQAFSVLNFQKLEAIEENIPNSDYLLKRNNNDFYILGPGDLIKVVVSEFIPDLTQSLIIDQEGMGYLKKLKNVYMNGLTKNELENILNEEYSKYVNTPSVRIQVLKFRPVKIFIDGAVSEPGYFSLEKKGKNIGNLPTGMEIDDINTTEPIDLVYAIQQANGLNNDADISNISITRQNSISNGGGRIKTSVDLLKAIELKDPKQNIRILDGDTIYIPHAKNVDRKRVNKLLKSNLNPRTIDVFVGGSVASQGMKTLLKSSTLNDAIFISGGAELFSGKVKFFRYGTDGLVDDRQFKFNKKSKRGSFKNPFLRNGDIIFIGKSRLTMTNEALQKLTAPVASIINAYSLYKIID